MPWNCASIARPSSAKSRVTPLEAWSTVDASADSTDRVRSRTSMYPPAMNEGGRPTQAHREATRRHATQVSPCHRLSSSCDLAGSYSTQVGARKRISWGTDPPVEIGDAELVDLCGHIEETLGSKEKTILRSLD